MMRNAATAAADDALPRDLAALLGRAAAARSVSESLASPVAMVHATSRVVCEVVASDRDRWRTWHATMGALRARTADRPDLRVLRMCLRCDAVCAAVDEWIVPPAWVRHQLLGGAGGVSLVGGMCPECLSALDPAIDGERTDRRPRSMAAVRAAEILALLGDIERGAVEAARRFPALGEDDAMAAALAAAIARAIHGIPVNEPSAVAHALHELLRRLRARPRRRRDRGGPPPRVHPPRRSH